MDNIAQHHFLFIPLQSNYYIYFTLSAHLYLATGGMFGLKITVLIVVGGITRIIPPLPSLLTIDN